MTDSPFIDFNIHNPGSLSKTVLLAEFTARQDLLDEILTCIRQNKTGQPCQHLLLVGARGMGKTTTLYATAYSVEDDAGLSAVWLPLVFSEENYGIGDLADFWLEAIRYLQGQLNVMEDHAQDLLAQELATPVLTRQAQAMFFQLVDQSNRRVILLLDNINEVMRAMQDEAQLHQLRAVLMADARLMLIGASTSYFDQITHLDKPFYDFFRTIPLERFRKTEMEAALRTLATRRQDDRVLEILASDPGRVNTLRILTGGNPRLVKMVYRLLHEGVFGDVRADLQRLLDDCTPYFKHRIEGLGTQARRVFDAIARQWDPVSVGHLKLALRKEPNYISVQMKRLIAEGFVEVTEGSTAKKKTYQVAERFYNIFYLMRYSRDGRHRLLWLASFMQIFYSLDDYRKWADQAEQEARGLKGKAQQEERLSLMSTMACAAEDEGLQKALLQQTIKTTIDVAGFDAITRIVDVRLAKQKLGAHFSMLAFLGELSAAERVDMCYEPEDARWWCKLGVALYHKNQDTMAEQAWRQAIELDPESAYPWNGLGNLLQTHLSEYEAAERAYRQAIELDPELAYPWYGLGELLQTHLNQYEAAERAYRQAIELDPEYATPWNGLGNLLQIHLNQYEAAERAYRQAIELDPEFAYPWNGLGNLLKTHLNQYEAAERAYRQAIELDPEFAYPWNGLGNLLQDHLNQYEAAERAYRQAIELDPEYAYPWNGLGNLLKNHLNQYEAAERAYRQAIELDPEFAAPHSGLAELLSQQLKRPSEALTAAIKGVQLEPDYGFARYIFLQICRHQAEPWLQVLPDVLAWLQHQDNESVYQFALDGLIRLVGYGETQAVRALVTASAMQLPFEPLLLALEAREDAAVLTRLAPERRTLVVEVMARLADVVV